MSARQYAGVKTFCGFCCCSWCIIWHSLEFNFTHRNHVPVMIQYVSSTYQMPLYLPTLLMQSCLCYCKCCQYPGIVVVYPGFCVRICDALACYAAV